VHEYTNVSVYFQVKMSEKWGKPVLDKVTLAEQHFIVAYDIDFDFLD
jgi:hypothetical protein